MNYFLGPIDNCFRHSAADYVQTPYRPWEQNAIRENLHADMKRARKGPEFRYESGTYPQYDPLPDEEWTFFVGDKVYLFHNIILLLYLTQLRNSKRRNLLFQRSVLYASMF